MTLRGRFVEDVAKNPYERMAYIFIFSSVDYEFEIILNGNLIG